MNIALIIMKNKQITNYVNGYGAIWTRNHPELHYGHTGQYWTDASCKKGTAWFLPDSVEVQHAVSIPLKHIFTKDSTYVNGSEVD